MKKSLNANLPKTPLLAIDCVVIDSQKNILLIRRKNPPFEGALALPGGFVEIGETVEDACSRELNEETGIKVRNFRLLGVYSDPYRDPRGHVCSIAYVCRVRNKLTRAGNDAAKVLWTQSWRRLSLGFDHKKIISDAFETFIK